MPRKRVEDEIAINAMLSEMYQAWVANDADRFVKHYTDDATAILPGSLRGSRKVIRDAMAAGFDGPLRGSSTPDRQLSLRFIGHDAAIADQRGRDPICRREHRAGGAEDPRDLGVGETRWPVDGRGVPQQPCAGTGSRLIPSPRRARPRVIPGLVTGRGSLRRRGATPPSWRGIGWYR